MSDGAQTRQPKRKWNNLEMVNQMFKDAFLVKKTRFSEMHPELSDEALHKMTVEYFKKLNQSPPQ